MLGRPKGGPFFAVTMMQSGDRFSVKPPHYNGFFQSVVARVTESRHNLGKIEAIRHNVRSDTTESTQDEPAAQWVEGGKAVVSRITGATVRALLVMILVVTPSVMLPGISADTKQMVALASIFAALLTFVEYHATAPGLIEFRDAPPFNRMRFFLIYLTVIVLSLIERGRTQPGTFTDLLTAIGHLIGWAMDFPYSPVRLATLMLAPGASSAQAESLRTAAGMAYVISLLFIAVFVLVIRARNWPLSGAAFNVWINLPTFDPTAGADIITRLERDARVNVALGFLLPFLVPAFVRVALDGADAATLTGPQTLIWATAAWSFLPASLFMRGIAMQRVAQMVRDKRRAAADHMDDEYPQVA